MHSDLKKWLFKKEQPAKLRVTLEDGEQHIIVINREKRGGWAEAEQTVAALNPLRVEALQADGVTVLRAVELRKEAPAGDDDDDDDDDAGSIAAGKPRDRMERIVREMGIAIEKAYNAGANAAATSANKLIDLCDKQGALVDKLAQHLSTAIAEHHQTAATLGAQLAGGGGGHDQTEMMIMQLIAANSGAGGGAPPLTIQGIQAALQQMSPQHRSMLQAALATPGVPKNGQTPGGKPT
jgi:hypothetical protein